MRRLFVILAGALAMAVGTTAGAAVTRTIVSTWNPVSTARTSLKVTSIGSGECGPGSDVLGDYAYRCGRRSPPAIADPCWRDGPRSDRVLCTSSPWRRRVLMMRVPDLLFVAGVTFAHRINPQSDQPWALELMNGTRCTGYQGAHSAIDTPRGRRWIEYYCNRPNVGLLGNVSRGRVWHITSVRGRSATHYRLRNVAIRRAVFPSLPSVMQEQNDTARAAARGSGLLRSVLRVRLAMPGLEWANVQALTPTGSPSITLWRLVRRRGHVWRVVRLRRPACRSRLPASVRHQLFGCPLPR